jgi:hypothetical protein
MDRVHGLGSWVHGIGTHLGSSNPRSMIRIFCTERVSTHLILVILARSDGGTVGFGQGRRGLTLTVACLGRAWWLAGVWVFSSHGGRFPMRFSPMGSQRRRNSIRPTLIDGGRQWSLATVRCLGRLWASMCTAFNGVSTLRIGGEPS